MKTVDFLLFGLYLALVEKGMPRVRLSLSRPAPKHALRNIEVAAGRRRRHPAIPGQPTRLDLELAAEYLSSHDRASGRAKTLSRWSSNRRQARLAWTSRNEKGEHDTSRPHLAISRRKLFHMALAGGLAVPVAARSQTLRPIELITFPGGSNWPIWVGMEKGHFARHGVEIRPTPTPNAVFQLTNLIDGRFDMAVTAIDNVIAYAEGQNEAGLPPAADLRGRELSVDALTTGYAFVLHKLVELGGLRQDEVSYVRAGGVLQRFQALLEKRHAGTLLISPFEVQAEAQPAAARFGADGMPNGWRDDPPHLRRDRR